jgi:hypothetical protein
MKYPIITLEAAKECLDKHRSEVPWSASSLVRWIGNGEMFDEKKAQSLYAELAEIRMKFGSSPLPKGKGGEFEAVACQVVHHVLELDVIMATSREFWLWLTFAAVKGKMVGVVDWRFGSQDSIEPVNYGIGRNADLWEGLFARLWWRGNIGHAPSAPNPYEVAQKGDMDIWRSHVIRQEYGRCRNLARALIKYQYPSDDNKKKTLKTKELRKLAKRLRIIDASVSFELLGEPDLEGLITENAERIKNIPD